MATRDARPGRRAWGAAVAAGLLAATGCQGPSVLAARFALGRPGDVPVALARMPVGPEAPVGAALAVRLEALAGAPGARRLAALPASWDTAELVLSHPTALKAPRTATLTKGVGITPNGAGGYVASAPFGGALRPASGYSLGVRLYGAGDLEAEKTVAVDLVGGANAVAVALDLAGPLVGAPYAMSGTAPTQADPAIAAGPADALAIWVDDRATPRLDVVARRLAGDGSKPGGEAVATPATVTAPALPHLAFDPARGQALVAWQHGTTAQDVHATLVSAAGTPVGAPLTLSATAGAQVAPRVSYFGRADAYLVLWTDQQAAGSDVVGQAVYGTGAPWGPPTTFAGGAGAQFAGDAAGADRSDRMLVVWCDGGPSRLRGRLYNSLGAVTLADFDLATDATAALREPCVAADPTTGDFVVAWVAAGASHAVQARRVSAAGVLGPIATIDAAGAEKAAPRLAWAPWLGRFLLTWQLDADASAAVDLDARAAYVAPDGTRVGAAFDLAAGPGDQTRPEAAAIAGQNRFVATYANRAADGTRRIYAQRLR